MLILEDNFTIRTTLKRSSINFQNWLQMSAREVKTEKYDATIRTSITIEGRHFYMYMHMHMKTEIYNGLSKAKQKKNLIWR